MFTRAYVCVVCIQMGKENIKTAKKSAPRGRGFSAWLVREKTEPARLYCVYTVLVGGAGEEKEENDEEEEEDD